MMHTLTTLDLNTAFVLLPELIILFSALLLFFGVVFRPKIGFFIHNLFTLVLIIAIAALMTSPAWNVPIPLLSNSLFFTSFGNAFKLIILLSSLGVMMLANPKNSTNINDKLNNLEFPVLILFATFGLMMLPNANNMIVLYMGVEVSSLSMYIMISMNRDRLTSSEAGLKYFVLGSLASAIMLFGMSYIYGFAGSVNFMHIQAALANNNSMILYAAIVLMMVSMFFKLSLVPFHFWAPDVYQGAPLTVVALLATAAKVAMIGILIRILNEPLFEFIDFICPLIMFFGLCSVVIGAISALWQTNIRRLLAFSSISHMGYIMLAISVSSGEAVRAVILYLVIYTMSSVALFGCLMSITKEGKEIHQISELAGLSKERPFIALILSLLLFSMAGIPPIAGFLAKFMVLSVLIKAGFFIPAIIAVIASVIGAYYYLNLIKSIYFDSPTQKESVVAEDKGMVRVFDRQLSSSSIILMGMGLIVSVAALAFPAPIINLLKMALS